MKMFAKKTSAISAYLLFGIILLFMTTACGKYRVDPIVDIEPHETAFVVPLESGEVLQNTEDGVKKVLPGDKFVSADYLRDRKIAVRRFTIPQRKRSTGRLWMDFQYIPTVRVLVVNRTPVTREWTKDSDTGTSKKNQSFWLESSDSIEFAIGANITASIAEEDAHIFLYNYPSTAVSKTGIPVESYSSLEYIIDTNVRGYFNSILSDRFARLSLVDGRAKKAEIFQEAFKLGKEHFKNKGITIENFGLSEGMVYRDKEIQTSINENFQSEMTIQIEANKKLAQREVNLRNISIAETAKREALEFAQAEKARIAQVNLEIEKMRAQAALIFAEKFNGQLPEKIIPSNSQLLMGLD